MSDYASKLYSMELMDEIRLGPMDAVRVPGGWVFFNRVVSAFVPFDNEFQPSDFVQEAPCRTYTSAY